MNKIYTFLSSKTPKIAVLIDPEKWTNFVHFNIWVDQIILSAPDLFLVGGSTATREQTHACIKFLKQKVNLPIVLFPGGAVQVDAHADAILFMSMISGRNPQFLIEEQVRAARTVHTSGIETIPTSYLLLDGGTVTSTEKISKTSPMLQNNKVEIEDTVLAGALLGHTCTYLDSGSGAIHSVSTEIIESVVRYTNLLFVGGGIRNIATVKRAHESGAKVVVVGNHLEKKPDFAAELAEYVRSLR